jgi:hypothetical protein
MDGGALTIEVIIIGTALTGIILTIDIIEDGETGNS